MKTCSRCKKEKQFNEFGKCSRAKNGLMSYCKACASERVAEYKKRHPEKVAESARKAGKKYTEKNKEIVNAKNRERAIIKRKDPAFRKRNCEHAKTKRDNLKIEMIESLGGACSCCGIKEPRFLSIEHIGGGGSEHRKMCGGTSYGVLLDAKRLGWPRDRFDVLCFNCNLARAKLGYCPHEKAKKCQ